MRITVKLGVGEWITSIANVLTAGELLGYCSIKEAICEGAFGRDWCKVAGKIRMDVFLLGRLAT